MIGRSFATCRGNACAHYALSIVILLNLVDDFVWARTG